MQKLTDKSATFCRVMVDGHIARCVILMRNTLYAMVRPVNRFDVMYRVSVNELYEFN